MTYFCDFFSCKYRFIKIWDNYEFDLNFQTNLYWRWKCMFFSKRGAGQKSKKTANP